MLIAVAEVLEVADVLVFGEQRFELGFGLGVLELVAFELADRFAEPPRHPRDRVVHRLDAAAQRLRAL